MLAFTGYLITFKYIGMYKRKITVSVYSLLLCVSDGLTILCSLRVRSSTISVNPTDLQRVNNLAANKHSEPVPAAPE